MFVFLFIVIFSQENVKDLSVFKDIEENKLTYFRDGFFYKPNLEILNTEETFYTKINKIKKIFVKPKNINQVISKYLFNMFLIANYNHEIINLDLNYLGVADPIEAELDVIAYLERLISEDRFLQFFLNLNIDEIENNLIDIFSKFKIIYKKNDFNKAYIQKFLFALKRYIKNKNLYLRQNKIESILLPNDLKTNIKEFVLKELFSLNKSAFEYVVYKNISVDYTYLDTSDSSDRRTISYEYRPTKQECYASSYYLNSMFLKKYLNLFNLIRLNTIVIVPLESKNYLKIINKASLVDDIIPNSTCWTYHVASFYTIYYEGKYYNFIIDSFFKDKIFVLEEWLDKFDYDFNNFAIRFYPFQKTSGIEENFLNLDKVKELKATPYKVKENCD